MGNNILNTLYKVASVSLITGFVLISSCKKEDSPCCDKTNPECPNYDPCYDKVLPSAKIIIGDGTNLFDVPYFYEDSVFKGFQITFKSNIDDPEIKHRWYLGSETIENVTSLTRSFDEVPRPATLSITHVIAYSPDTICFPNDDGYDSITQTFYLINKHSELLSTGTFRGVREGETDSFDISFYFQRFHEPKTIDPNWSEWWGSIIDNKVVNFDNNGDTLGGLSTTNRMYIAHYNHNLYFKFKDENTFYGTGYVDDNGRIELNYGKNKNTPKENYVKFIGRKIN